MDELGLLHRRTASRKQ